MGPIYSRKYAPILAVLALLILITGAFLLFRKLGEPSLPPPTATYAEDTTLGGPVIIEEGTRQTISNGATVTIQGDLNLAGRLDCDNGPLTIIVTGALNVLGEMFCERSEQLASEDLGMGISIVAKGLVNFAPSAKISTNGRIQIVNDESKLATTQAQLDKLYDDAGADSGQGFRIGPFIEIPLDPSQVVVPTGNNLSAMPVPTDSPVVWNNLRGVLVPEVSAAEPAVDQFGNVVDDTVRIGGNWVVGDPSRLSPDELRVNTPPKDIKKIIIAFNFGPTGTVSLRDFTLYGPDGQVGADDTGSCNVKSGDGANAFRLNITASNVTINNFDLFLGYGGNGGFAETSSDCDHGQATGGNGGEPSNFKIIGTQNLTITGAFKVHPGQGGIGGQAVAHGKDGQNACGGEDGGDATATGGKGGDNKKGLKVTGTVTGISNIEIDEIRAGAGGDADADGGKGGNGTGCGCDGGQGGDATAVGGQGGDATSRTVPSHGGDGGGVTAIPGLGGDGGSCGPEGPGGDGGAGGNANLTSGKPGTGLTGPGADGTIWQEAGGDGGNGGDGCLPGNGGTGGNGNPLGEDGDDGKNKCLAEEEENDTTSDTSEEPEDATPPETFGEEIDTEVIQLQIITPGIISFIYDHANPRCPLPITPIQIAGPDNLEWYIEGDLPIWLSAPNGLRGTGPGSIPLAFPCQLNTYENQQQSTSFMVGASSPDGQSTQQNMTVNGNFTNF